MPTYEYQCIKCGKSFDRVAHIKEHDASRVRCPKCKSGHARQVFGNFFAKTSRKS